MKIIFGLLALFLTANILCAQQSALRGEVSIINSRYETKTRQYVANAQVEEGLGRAQPATTDAGGYFNLIIVGVQEKESITFSVKKEGLEVVNADALSAVAGQKEMVKVYMATPQKIADYKKQYYQIGKTAAEKALEEKLNILQTERQSLLTDKNADKNRIADLETQLGQLEARRGKIDEDARELANRYAPINLDDASPLYQEAFSWFQKGELGQALNILQKANLEAQANSILGERLKINAVQRELMLRDSIQKQRTTDVLSALSLKADLHQSRFEFDSATVCFDLMLALDSTDYVNVFKFAYFLGEQNQHYRAIDLYEKCLKLAETDVQRSDLLNNLGALYCDNQKMLEAEKAYNKALSIYRKLNENTPDIFLADVAGTLNNLGVYYYSNRRMSEAEKSYCEALSIYRKLAEQNAKDFLPYVAITQGNLATYYRANQKMPEAEKSYNEALSINRNLAEQNVNAFLPDVAMTLSNLSSYYYFNKRMPEAEATFHEALGIYRKLVGENPEAFLPYMAATLNNLGAYYHSNKRMSEAEKPYNEALSIRRKLAEQNPHAFLHDVAETANNIGAFYSDNQKMSEAETAFKEALNDYRKLADQNPDIFLSDVAATLNNLGLFRKTLKQYSQAIDYYEAALTIRQAALLTGETHFLKDWERVFNNMFDVKDSTEALHQYALTTRAGQLMAVSCDSLRHLDPNILKEAVSQYGSLSWWAVFAKDYALAERTGLRCLALDETQIYVWTNIGHARWLSGKEAFAKTAWQRLKGRINASGMPYEKILQADWQTLESAGVAPQGAFDAARKWVGEE